MKRVVIVEDEKLVLLGIESLFVANSEYQIVGSFTRASAALAELPTLDPDIIVTDIKMPGMDGLEFLQHLQEHHIRAKIIILSCLEDFAIVSKAFKLGAVDYVLKHELNEQELFRILDGIPIEQPMMSESEIVHEPWNELCRFSDRLEKGEDIVPHIEKPLVCLLVCKKKYVDNHVPMKTNIDTVWTMRFVHRLLTQLHLGAVFFEDTGKLVLVIDGSEKQNEERKRFFNQLILQLKQYINSPVVILRGIEFEHSSIAEQWAYLLSMHDVAFYVDSTRITVGKRSCLPNLHEKIELPDPILLLQPETLVQWNQHMVEYFKYVQGVFMDSSQLCMNLIVYWHQVKQLVKDAYGENGVEMLSNPSVYEYLKEFDDFYHLHQWYMTELPKKIRRIHNISGHSRKIMRMKLYVLEHYNEHISLQDIGQILHANSNYLCSLFKKEVKKGFIEYLNSIRIDKAKSLLMQDAVTVEEISVQVGFTSPSHFSKIFKRITGQTVSEFRAKHACKPNIEQEI
ncbi:MAG: response regulator [Sphaerochaetaceae bacterium]|nr:response regulator [Sphaerochaetaceae bacterium]